MENFREIKSLDFIEIKKEEFYNLRNYVYKQIGINLGEDKIALVTGRLQKILRKLNLNNFSEYYNYLISEKTGEALSELANTISTNHTFFGREREHFDFFQHVALPEIVERCKANHSKDIRIWSAGCSSGEEPYTLVMLMQEFFGDQYKNWDAGVLATDISLKALAFAKTGVYPVERIGNLQENFKKKYFKKTEKGEFEVIDSIKKEVTFRRFNLMNPQFPFKKKFDVIFCRNVMIYFDEETRTNLVDKFYDLTVPDGYLFIGHSESLKRNLTRYHYIKPALYKKIL